MTVRLEVHNDGLYALRSDPTLVAHLESLGQDVLDAAGGEEAGYAMSSEQGAKNPQGRWRVSVFTKTDDAKRDNAENNTLIHALSAAD